MFIEYWWNEYWNFLEKLEGEWIGDISREPGEGKGTSSYSKLLQEKFIRVVNKVEFPP